MKVAETGSVTRAARALGVSKSMASSRLAALERLAGEQLVARTTRSLALTDAGRDLFDEVAPMVERLGRLGARPSASPFSGRLRVIAMIDVGQHEVAAALAALGMAHPALQTEIVLSNESADPRAGGFDLAFNFRRARITGLEQELVGRFACGVFASPAYLQAHGAPDDPTALASHRCLGYSFQAGVDDWNAGMWSFAKGGDHRHVRVPLVARANSSALLRAAVEEGAGIAVLPVVRAEAAVAAGRLARVLADWSLPRLALNVVWARPPRGRSPARELVAAIRRAVAVAQGVP